MEKQYCKVGTVKALNTEEQSIAFLEYLYQNFIDKASNIKYANTQLGDFFESKAKKLEKLLKEM
ncbi:hypothetical protein [Cellulophaga sp. Hel_I_12]|uniref:hypothetical protein n=1 Tax=Cellulophaga sp. Hel_I_12 TaxID=1249972 RepID=UPI00064723E9|nr:hypothetical protein [Cellulophaga sp. Hel_I_12]